MFGEMFIQISFIDIIHAYYHISIEISKNKINEFDIKNRRYYFLDDMINTKKPDPNKIKI